MGRFIRGTGRWLFRVYLSVNMLIAAIMPWSKPRETISGMCGRLSANCVVARVFAIVIDKLYWYEIDHCADTARCESRARKVLGYEQ